MANLRPLGRHTRTTNKINPRIPFSSSKSYRSWSWNLRTHSTTSTPSRVAMASNCVTSPASVSKTTLRSRCINSGCCGSRMPDHGGSSVSAWPSNQPSIRHLGAYVRVNICNLNCCHSEAQGARGHLAVARSSQPCCCGHSAAAALGPPSSILASCSSDFHHVLASRMRSGGIPLPRSQLPPSHAATAAGALLVQRRRGLATAAASAPEAPSTDSGSRPLPLGDLDDLLYTPGEEVPYYRGPLELREVPDSGVGVFVTEDVPCGTVLLACYPLALLRGRPAGHSAHAPSAPALLPSPLELAHALDGAIMSPLAAAWMLGLYDGVDDDEDDSDVSDDGGDGSGWKRRRFAQLRQLFRQPFDATSAAAPDADDGEEEGSSRGSAGGVTKGVRCPLPAEAVARVVTFNAYGEARPDPAVATVKSLSGDQMSGCVGLWPPFSLINHSCAPVASYGLVGDVMVVRAATDLSAGQQVTISYFGRRALAPLELRRAYLAQHYGFICSCERCTLEAAGLEEEGQQEGEGRGRGRGRGEEGDGAAGTARLALELPAFLENLHMTCSRAAAPHLNDMLTGRRWTAAAAVASGGGIGGVNGAVRRDEPVSELVDELSELYSYLSGCWQQLLRAAAAASGAAVEGEEEEGVEAAAAAVAAGGGGLSQQEVFWLEGSVFVLLDQLLVVVGSLGLLKRVEEQQQSAAAKSTANGGAGGVRKGASAPAAKGASVRRVAASPGGKAAGRGEEDGVVDVADENGSATAAAAAGPPLTAAAAMHAVASRRWRVDELPRNFLLPYVDLLAQAQEVAAAVAPGSDLAVACAVRLLYGIQAVLGPESDEFREAEISCYDALSARYGILNFDVYEQVLEVCTNQYSAQEVRLPGLSGEAVAAASPASFLLDVGAGEGGMVGLHIPAVPVEAEVVEE